MTVSTASMICVAVAANSPEPSAPDRRLDDDEPAPARLRDCSPRANAGLRPPSGAAPLSTPPLSILAGETRPRDHRFSTIWFRLPDSTGDSSGDARVRRANRDGP